MAPWKFSTSAEESVLPRISLSVYLLATLYKSYRLDLHDNFTKDDF